MTDECRNDCIDKLLFPRQLSNRPGLSRIDYRIGTYSDILEALHRKLNQNDELVGWTHREADDPGIALLEGASILGDILTFYQEVYANEAYLRTAQWRESIADLVRLLGYPLSPGLGGKATFGFDVKGDKPVVIPTGFPVKAQLEEQAKPVDFETIKEQIVHPSLGKFNLFTPITYPYICPSTKDFYIYDPPQAEGSAMLEKGDRLLIGFRYPITQADRLINSEIVIVDEVYEMHGRQFFKIKGALKREHRVEWLAAYKLARSFRHFGHNAPSKYIKVAGDNEVKEEKLLYSRTLTATTSSFEVPTTDATGAQGVRIVEPNINEFDFPLDSEINDLPVGGKLIIQAKLWGWNSYIRSWVGPKNVTLLRSINNVDASSLTWGSITGATTLISVNKNLATIEGSINFYVTDIRYLQIHEVISPTLKIRAAVKEIEGPKGDILNFYGTKEEAECLKSRRLIFEKPDGKTFERKILAYQLRHWDRIKEPPLSRILVFLDEPVNYQDFPNENPKVTVYGNLVEAAQGKSEKESVLGSGDNRETFQTFKLPKAPLTYFIAKDDFPPEVPELQVYVSGRLWTRVPSFYGHGHKERIYIVREDANGNSWVQFGDGKTGSRLPSGLKNVVARYRTGTGAYGPLKDGANPQPGSRIDRLRKVYLPGIVTGGSEPEDGDNAREAAPGKIQSLGRLVSLKDFETEVLGISGVEKATARWRLENNIPTVVITVLLESGREKEGQDLQDTLSAYNKDRGPERFPVAVHLARRQYVYLTLIVGFDPSYQKEQVNISIKEVLGVTGEEDKGIDGSKGLFGIKQRRFGQKEYASRIEGVVQNVRGVIWAKVDKLGFVVGDSDDPLELTRPEPLQYHAVIPGLLPMGKSLIVREQPPPDSPYPKVKHGKSAQKPQPVVEDMLFCLHVTHLDVIPGTVNATEVIADD